MLVDEFHDCQVKRVVSEGPRKCWHTGFSGHCLPDATDATIMIFVTEKLTLEINGEARSVPAMQNVAELLGFLGLAQDRIAVELNRRILRRADWGGTAVADGDRIEIVQFVGGG